MDEARRPRAVVVDDAVFMRRQIRDFLESDGCEVAAEGEDGSEVLELYETHRPDLVTLDVVMPRVNGLEALRELKARHPEARVIVCSSLTHEQALFEALRLGARDYVVKPLNREKFLEAARKAIRGPA